MRTFVVAVVALIVGVSLVEAQVQVFVRGAGKLIPIATPQLCVESGDPQVGRVIPEVIGRNLLLSGYFEVLDPGGYVETPGRCGNPESFAYSDWSVIGTEGLVRGVVRGAGNGAVTVQMYLFDIPKQRLVLGKEYTGTAAQARAMAHRFSNEIMKFFTGTLGPFGSQIAFSGRVGRFKELFVMDMDGSNLRQLTSERGLAISPALSPNGREVVYTTYRNRVPDLAVLDLFSRRSRVVTKGSALELGAKFLPGSDGLLASVTGDRDSDIVVFNQAGAVVERLTRSGGSINVSPSLSPDGRQIAFCSSRGGGPQIYVMDRDGSNPRRVSFVRSNYCTSPAWAPTGDRIAFVCRADGGFNVFTANPDGSDPLQLTVVGSNEDPSWSPDGRYLAMGSTLGRGGVFQIAIVRRDGQNLQQISSGKGGDFQPSWGPILD